MDHVDADDRIDVLNQWPRSKDVQDQRRADIAKRRFHERNNELGKAVGIFLCRPKFDLRESARKVNYVLSCPGGDLEDTLPVA